MSDEEQYAEYANKFLENHPEWHPFAHLVLAPPELDEVAEKFPEVRGSVLSQDPFDFTSFGVTRLALYVKLREEGQGHRWAEMISLQRGPVLSTDDTFFQGVPRLYEQFGSQKNLDRHLKAAKAHGFTPSPNAIYMPGLARFQGDPEAWVTRAMGRSYIKKLCEKRGWACEGAVNVKARDPENDPLDQKNCVPLANDIVNRIGKEMVRKDPSLQKKSKSELREMVIAKHGPRKG